MWEWHRPSHSVIRIPLQIKILSFWLSSTKNDSLRAASYLVELTGPDNVFASFRLAFIGLKAQWIMTELGVLLWKTDNASSTASLSEFCTRSDIVNSTSGSSGAAHCDDVQQTSTTHPALYFFIIARLMNGIGNSGTTVLSVAYIDENTSKTKSPLYIGM